MSAAVTQLLAGLHELSAAERVEFFALVAAPAEEVAQEWTEEDSGIVAAQTFARLDAEEEQDGRSHP